MKLLNFTSKQQPNVQLLMKEKGELLSKVSGGDVLRICQLEERLQVELDNSHCLEIELAEAERLLRLAVDDMSEKIIVLRCAREISLLAKFQILVISNGDTPTKP